MTTKLGSAITEKLIKRITGTGGVGAVLAALTPGIATQPSAWNPAQVRAQNVAPDVADRNIAQQYPTVNVYCEKIANKLTEKFRAFSGTAEMTVELRYSQDRLEGLQDALELYADAIMQVLDAQRGDWGDGLFFAGAYQTAFGAVKQGGKNFIQAAKITFEIGVSRA